MDKDNFFNHFDNYIENGSQSLIDKFLKNEKFYDIIFPIIKKTFLKVSFIEIRLFILMSFIEKIKNNDLLYKKLNSQFVNIDDFQNSISICEAHIYKIFEQIESLINHNINK